MSYTVLLGSRRVGQLSSLKDGRWAFSFRRSYIDQWRRPVLGQYFEDDLEKTYVSKRPGRLPGFFAHLLPEGRLRGVLEKSLGLQDSGDAELLAAVSRDLPGAVRLLSDNAAPADNDEVPDSVEADGTVSSAGGFRFSLGGAQLKFSMLRDESRFTIPAHGALGAWIVKIAIAGFGELPWNEYSMLEWARSSGFAVPEAAIVPPEDLGQLRDWIGDRDVGLAVRRYDRENGRRIHQEDFAQVLGVEPRPDGTEKYEQTYENIAKLTAMIVGPAAAEEVLLRVAFIVATGNADAHLKNWSLLYRDGIVPELSPLYDQVATVAWPKHMHDRELALKLAGARDFGRVRIESFGHMAERAGLDAQRCMRLVRDRLSLVKSAWPAALDAGLPDEHAAELRAHWARVPMLRYIGSLE